MQIADPLGVPGAPLETLHEVQARFAGSELQGGRLVLVTDSQGHRDTAAYGALLVAGAGADAPRVVTEVAFGPRFGLAGAQALAQLVQWAVGLDWPVRETVLSSADFNRVMSEPDAEGVKALLAASNPSDAAIYTRVPKHLQDEE